MSKAKLVVISTLLLILAAVNWSIFNKQQHLASGANLYLKLAPVDPRSIMQGDYMALRFSVSPMLAAALLTPPLTSTTSNSAENSAPESLATQDGLAILTLDENGVGHYSRLVKANDNAPSLNQRQLAVRYRVRGGKVKFATNAFFFEEGQGKTFSRAQYGHFKVDTAGELLLVAMLDEKFKKIENQPQEDIRNRPRQRQR